MKCVFVSAVGIVDTKDIPEAVAQSGRYRTVKTRPFVVAFDDLCPWPLVDEFTDYERKGEMFDGTPIFCAANFDVQEAAFCDIVALRDVTDQSDADLLQKVRRYTADRYQRFVSLDQWVGPLSATAAEPDLAAQRLTKRGARVLVAIDKS